MSYNQRKAAQTVAYFVMKNSNSPLNTVKAIKLVYLADRESIASTGFPIQAEPRVSTRTGPVNATTYAFMNGECSAADTEWSDTLSDAGGHKVGLADLDTSADDLDELSATDIQVLNTVWEKFGKMSGAELVTWTYSLQEWEGPGDESRVIPLKRIMHALSTPDAAGQAELVEGMTDASHKIKRL